MKTLNITLEYPPQIGGIASFVYNLSKHWPDDNFVVYAPKMKGDKEFDQKNKWKVFRHKPYFFFIWPHWLRLLWQVRQIVKKEKIERIFVHHVLPVGYIAWLLKKVNKIPYTVFFHGTDLEVGTKNKWKKKRLEQVCFLADKIIVNSNFLKNKFESKFENLKKEIQIINPCPSDIFFTTISNKQLKKIESKLALQGKKVILTVSRMAEGKGYPHLVHALPKILEKVPSLVWVIVGDGPKKQIILDLIQKKSLQNVVRFVGQVPQEELLKYYQVADLFVLLTHPDTEAEEGWGTVFLEAAASGLPVVAGQAGGSEEAVLNLKTGLVVDVNHEEAVVSAIIDLLEKEKYAKGMGGRGRQRVLEEFRWNQQIKKLKL